MNAVMHLEKKKKIRVSVYGECSLVTIKRLSPT